MRFRIDGIDWFKRLAFVMPAVPAVGKSEKTWAEGIFVEANEQSGTVTLVTTDIKQIGMKITVKANVERSGKALLPRHLANLFDLLQRDGEVTVDYNIETKVVAIASQEYGGKFPCLESEDFRVLGLEDEDASAKKFAISLEVFKTIVENVAPSADPKDIESGKSGVLLRGESKLGSDIPSITIEETIGNNKKTPVTYEGINAGPSRLVCVAADGKKFSKYQINGVLDSADASYFSTPANPTRPYEKVPYFEIIVPAGLMQTSYKAITALAQAKDSVDVSIFGGFVTFKCGNSAVALRLLAGELPNWRRILAASTVQFSFVVGVEDLKLAANIASVSNLGKREDPILMYINDKSLRIGNSVLSNSDRATRTIRTVVQTTGTLPVDEYKQGFRPDNMNHVLDYIKTEYVRLNFAGSFKPMTLQPCIVAKGDGDKVNYTTDQEFIALLMPLRVNA